MLSSSLNCEASPGLTSKKSTGSSTDRWCVCLASSSLSSYSAIDPSPGRFAIIRSAAPGSLESTNRDANSSGLMPCTRNSVDRSARDTSDITTIVMMKSDAILMPSGRSNTFVIVV